MLALNKDSTLKLLYVRIQKHLENFIVSFRKIARKIVNKTLECPKVRMMIRPLVRKEIISWNVIRETNFDEVVSFNFYHLSFLYHLKRMDSHGARLWWYGEKTFEPETVKLMLKIFPKIHCFWDVGAHMGTYSLLAAKMNMNIQIHSFEPVPVVFEGLHHNVLLNSLEKQITCHSFALGEENEIKPFYVHDEARVESSFTPSCANRPFTEIINMQIKKADDLNILQPDLIKIDVEDFEPNVLIGMENIMKEKKPMIICEVTRRSDTEKLKNIFKDYDIFLITESQLLKKENFSNQNRVHGNYENYFLVHKENDIVKNLI